MEQIEQNTQVLAPQVEVLPPAPQGDDVFSGEDLQLLQENRNLRRLLICELARGGKVPEDKADKSLLVSLLNGVDSEIMGRARIKVAAKTEEAVNNLTSLVGHALLHYDVRPNKKIEHAHIEPPAHVTFREPVAGEMDIGTINLKLSDVT